MGVEVPGVAVPILSLGLFFVGVCLVGVPVRGVPVLWAAVRDVAAIRSCFSLSLAAVNWNIMVAKRHERINRSVQR